jgi:hypothetical protein
MSAEQDEWYSVRCVFQWTHAKGAPFEERITLWLAGSLDTAIELSESEAREYAENTGMTYLGFAQAYASGETEIESGTEVFSLLRDSSLPPKEYLDRYFDTGGEHQVASSDPT